MDASHKIHTGEEKYDTLYELDDRYHLSETDATLSHIPHHFGSRRINLAVVGVGRMGAIHLYNVLREPRANVMYILDASQERLDFMRKKYFLDERGIKTLKPDQWETLVNDAAVEALLVSTPTFTHEKYVREALEHNKHVLCEKPLAEDANAVKSLVELAQAKQLILLCAFNRRYDPSFRNITKQVRRGDIGQVRLIKTCSRDSPLPPIEYIKISGGIFHDCLVHDIDLILWVGQELPIEVHSYAHCYMPDYKALDDYDTVLVSMKFKSGLMSVTDLSRVSSTGYEQRIEVYGPDGCLKLDEMSRAGWEKHTKVGKVEPNNCYSFASRYLEAYANEIQELFNHIEANQTMEPINPSYLNQLCKIIHACEQSAREERAIKIEWTDEELSRPL